MVDDEMWREEDEMGDVSLSTQEEVTEVIELFLNIVVGISNPGTLRVRGKTETKNVVVLFDCGATQNFITPRVIEKLKFSLTNTTNYGVIMGTRTKISNKGICKNAVVALEAITINEDFLPLELGGIKLIIGKH